MFTPSNDTNEQRLLYSLNSIIGMSWNTLNKLPLGMFLEYSILTTNGEKWSKQCFGHSSQISFWMQMKEELWICNAVQWNNLNEENDILLSIISAYDDDVGFLKLSFYGSLNQMKSGWPVAVKHRCHIRLLESTNLGRAITSGMGK